MKRALKALDLFCGAGGATMGLMRAGFEVTGIDNNRKLGKRYPGVFVCADAFNPPVELWDFDFIWSSPPCQRFSVGSKATRSNHKHHDLIKEIRALLRASGVPYVIENVPQAPIRPDIVLTGAMFDLSVTRRRHFECSGWPPPFSLLIQDWRRSTRGELAVVAGHSGANRPHKRCSWRELSEDEKRPIIEANSLENWQKAMGIDWMATRKELAESIPPAYSKYIASAFLESVGLESAA